MNKKIITAVLLGISGIALYILSKSIKKKQTRSLRRERDELRARPNAAYAYEYTL